MTLRGARVVERCDLLGTVPFSDDPDCLFRPFLGAGHRASLDMLAIWMREAGMRVRLDPAGNLVGRYEGQTPNAAAVLIGSHIDSVNDAGRYDGPLGVMLGIELVSGLYTEKRRLPFAIEVIAFGDEEGSRFHTSMLCSRAVAGEGDPRAAMVQDAQGISLAQAMTAFPPLDGVTLTIEGMGKAARDPADFLCFLEAHIEQGPALEAANEALGVVTGIAGQLRYQLTITGRAGHAGTTSMRLRKDALAAAAEAVLAVERIAASHGDRLVATVGRLNALPGAVNVVPGSASFSLDIRSGDEALRYAAANAILAAIDEIVARRKLGMTHMLVQDLEATPCDPRLVQHLTAAVRHAGSPGRQMVSGAGHDAMILARITPTVMLFLRCKGGISHHPSESVTEADVEAALVAMERFVETMPAS
ncbi:MAG: allantoate amidohydrolase [Sphingobium sp.]